ncbi:Putative arsenical resistance operon repressor ArsR2 [uncultured archaeon]|nr:Putative arsenical resistance operon repressor ArsR2 [uncultured archaeon]
MDSGILRALADGTRFRLFGRISRGEVCACMLPDYVKTSQPAVSQHLKVLLGTGLVRMRKDGTKRIYSISEKGRRVLADVSRW